MSLSTIIAELLSVLGDLDGVDQASASDYLPILKAVDTALIIPPWDVRSAYGRSLALAEPNDAQWESHIIRVEFWTRQDDFEAAAERSRGLQSVIVSALFGSSGLNGEIDAFGYTETGDGFDTTIRMRTEDVTFGPDEARAIPFLRLVVDVPVYVGG